MYDPNRYLVICDVENTLLKAGYGIPANNIDAIERFTSSGGLFTLCSSGNKDNLSRITDWIKITAPAILDNGTYIYDFSSGETIYDEPLLFPEIKSVVDEILRMFPEIGVVISSEPGTYVIRMNESVESYLNLHHQKYVLCDAGLIPDNWHSVMLMGSERDVLAARKYSYMQESVKEEFSEFDYEIQGKGIGMIVPRNGTRAGAFNWYLDELGIPLKNVVYICGDPVNKEMVLGAGLKVALSDAPSEIRTVCDFTVSSCLMGGVSEVLDRFNDIVGNYEQTEMEF